MSHRLMLHVVARDGVDLGPAVADVPSSLTVMTRDPACFMGAASPFAAAVETTTDHLDALVQFARALV